MSFIFFILMCISICFLIYFTYNLNKKLRVKTKLITSFFFILTGLAGYFSSHGNFYYFLFIIFALVFSFIGDFFLALKNNNLFFLLGISSFSIAHICFSLAFITISSFKISYLLLAIIISLIVTFLLNSIKGFNFNNMYFFANIYAFLLVFMTLNATSFIVNLSLFSILAFFASLLFLLSDILLSFIYFYSSPPKYLSLINMITYYIAQGLFALTILYK